MLCFYKQVDNTFFEDPQADRRSWQVYERVEKGHGRLERRHITTSPDLNDYLRRDSHELRNVYDFVYGLRTS